MYPDFVGIGPRKRVHLRIWMPRKEVHYFERKANDCLKGIFGKSSTDQQRRKQVRHWTKRYLTTLPLPDLI